MREEDDDEKEAGNVLARACPQLSETLPARVLRRRLGGGGGERKSIVS